MGDVIDLDERKMRALADELLPVLRDRGSVLVDAVNIEDVGRWRRAARLAGRRLRERIRTGVAADGARVWAVSLDHEVTEGDLTRAGRAMDALLDERRRD